MVRPTPTKRRAYNGLRSSGRIKQKALLTLSISKPTSAHTTSATRSTWSRKTKAKVLKAGLITGVQVATRARTTATQRTGDVYRATSPFTGGQIEASNARGQKALTVDSGPAEAFLTTADLDILRWKSTPFTLIPVGDHCYCPRLIVHPGTALSRVLSPASYPLDSAVILIHAQGNLGTSLPYEAVRVLTVYDELHGLDFSGTRITLVDPKLFDSPDCSRMKQNAFHRKLGCWIDLLGHEIKVYNRETWHLNNIEVDYTQFQIRLLLSKGIHHTTHVLPLHGADPPRRQKPLQVSFSQRT